MNELPSNNKAFKYSRWCKNLGLIGLGCFITSPLSFMLGLYLDSNLYSWSRWLFASICIAMIIVGIVSSIASIVYAIMSRWRLREDFSSKCCAYSFCGFLLSGIILCFCITVYMMISCSSAKIMGELAEIRDIGLDFYLFAEDHDGKYPDMPDPIISYYYSHCSPEEIEHHFYFPKTKILRWVLTPHLRSTDDPDTILLRSEQVFIYKNKPCRIVYTISNDKMIIPLDEIIDLYGEKPRIKRK